jgi:hypothetical protein
LASFTASESSGFELVSKSMNAATVRRPRLESGLIVERVKAGLRNARAKGKVLGRPKKILDTKRIAALRAQRVGWKRIAAELGVGTIHQASRSNAPLLGGSKTTEKVF